MEKYLFCIIAVLAQPITAWYAYRKQDKCKAALKMPMLYWSGTYLAVQFFVFWKFCRLMPESMEKYSYLIQAAILIVFLIIEWLLYGSNKYIEDVQQREQDSIKDFKSLIRELEVCKVCVTDVENQNRIEDLLEKMRYLDPVSSPAVEKENQKIYDLIQELMVITDHELFGNKCEEIARQLEIRKIKNVKEQG